MREDERGLDQRTGVPTNELLPDLRRLAPVVISNHDVHSQTSVGLAPDAERMQEAITGLSHAMEEISQHDEPGAGVLGDELRQPLQVGNRGTARQRNACPPENIVLPEMGVGHYDGGTPRP